MNSELNEIVLSERCHIRSSSRIFAKEYVDYGVPFMRSKDVIDKSLGLFEKYDLYISEERFSEIKQKHGSPKRGDMLINSVGNRSGQPYIVKDEGDFYFKDGNILWLSNFEDLNRDFLAYWFKSEIGQRTLESIMIGSAQKAITIDSLRKLRIRIPSLEYQNYAVKILLPIDEKIAINKEVNKILEQIAQAIFKSWFVDFEPTRAKIAAREALLAENPAATSEQIATAEQQAAIQAISSAGDIIPTEQLQTIADLFPNQLVESELGEVPEGWSIDKIGEHITVTKGKSYKSSELNPSNTALVTLKSFKRGGGYREDGLKEYTGNYKAAQVIRPGELVMSLTDVTQAAEIIGKPAMVTINEQFKTLVASLDVAILRPKNQTFKGFFYGLMGTYRFHRYAESFASGTTVLHLNPKGITTFEFPMPHPELLKIYAELVDNFHQVHEVNVVSNRYLNSLRDVLLPELLRGELCVDNR